QIEVLITTAGEIVFATSEYELLLCIVDWAWLNETTLSLEQRNSTYKKITRLTHSVEVPIELQNTTLYDLVKKLDLNLVCTHRIGALENAISNWPLGLGTGGDICSNDDHLSGFRGIDAT